MGNCRYLALPAAGGYVITFVKGTDTLNFPSDQNRGYPLNDSLGQKGVLLRTKVLVMAVDVRKADTPLQIPVVLKLVSQAFFGDLENWFLNVCKGKLYNFYYTNSVTGETNLPVRWVNGFDFAWADGYWSGTIVLEKEIV